MVAGDKPEARNRGGGAEKGKTASAGIELKLKVVEHTWESRSPMEVTAMLERDRRSPATMSSGGVTGVNDRSLLEKNRARVSGAPRLVKVQSL